MHELGIVFKIIDTVKETAAENQVSKVLSVTLDVGEVSTVIPSYLTDCWDWAVQKHDILKTSKLIVHQIPALTYCQDCRNQYETVLYGKTCPRCGSQSTYLIQGNELYIKEIEVSDEDTADS
jgi:hydrogenase nickel incorporation protein HypA/HybF